MNCEMISSQWKPLPGGRKPRSGRITKAALDGLRSPFDQLVGTLQAQHGWNRERAAKDLLRRLAAQRAGKRQQPTVAREGRKR